MKKPETSTEAITMLRSNPNVVVDTAAKTITLKGPIGLSLLGLVDFLCISNDKHDFRYHLAA